MTRAHDWRIDLIEAHPALFYRPTGTSETVQGYPECGQGWRDLLERACVRIEAALAEGGAFTALQIKEKYGTLRFYWRGRLTSGVKAKVEQAIALAEARSESRCALKLKTSLLKPISSLAAVRRTQPTSGIPVTLFRIRNLMRAISAPRCAATRLNWQWCVGNQFLEIAIAPRDPHLPGTNQFLRDRSR